MSKHKNSTSWKPGQSGNPKGRPSRGHSISDWFKAMLSSDQETKEKLTRAILKQALRGDVAAQKMIWQYMDGMPQQDITSGGEPLGTFTDDQVTKIAKRITTRSRVNGDTPSQD